MADAGTRETVERPEISGLAAFDDCTCQNLRMASRIVTQYFETVLEPGGLKATQLPVLVAAARHGPLPMTRLAELLVMDRTTLTRNLGPLERAGLIAVLPGEDRRARMVALTRDGVRALETALPLWAEAQAAIVDALGRFQWGVLMDNLRATVRAARDSG